MLTGFHFLDGLAYCPQAAREDESSPLRWGEATFMWWERAVCQVWVQAESSWGAQMCQTLRLNQVTG